MFAHRNDVERGTWGSASFAAMYLADFYRVQIDVRAHGDRARFTKKQIVAIAAGLQALAAEMPDPEPGAAS